MDFVAAVSTKGLSIPLHIPIAKSKANGLRENSFVKCEQVMTIRKARLIERAWGRLTREQLGQVEAALWTSPDLSAGGRSN